MTPQSNAAYEHREPWLHEVEARMRPLFQAAGYPIPSNIRLTCGFPSRRGTATKQRALGQCWASARSKDCHFEIMVSPVLDDPMQVAGVLAHELIHAAVGLACGHRGPFGIVTRAIGLEGPMTATIPGEAFKRFLTPILDAAGPYPHAELYVGQNSGPKPQKGRLVALKCPVKGCGYPSYTTRFWLDERGPPRCPNHDELVEVNERPKRQAFPPERG